MNIMKNNHHIILPLKGLDHLQFGQSIDQILQDFGDADQIDQIEETEFETLVLHYNEDKLALFFEDYGTSRLACIETQNEESVLFGEKVFKLKKDAIIALMLKNGYTEIETEEEEGEERLSFEDAMTDFFFDADQLIAINWGVIINEFGEVEVH